MPPFRFIHCSDLHIDSPFKKLDGVDVEMRARLRAATSQAFANIVTLALKEKVDAVVIAGDVFDGEDKSLQAQFQFHRELKRLSGAGIPAFIAHGNHDPLDSWSQTLKWPDGVHVFSGGQVDAVPIVRDGQTVGQVYGISYPRKEVKDNLVPLFGGIDPKAPSVAVLHANVGNNRDHDPYAPCSLDDLCRVPVDYWALGHIHARQILKEAHPAVVYCGNPQARHFKEGGEKGCVLVTLEKGRAPDIVFHPVDTVRYVREEVDVTECDTLNAVIDRVQEACRRRLEAIDGRDLVVEWTLTGRTALRRQLQDEGNREDLRDEVLKEFEGGAQKVWVELEANTTGHYDLETLRQGKDFIADVIAQYDRIIESGDLKEIHGVLEPVFGGREGWMDPPDEATLREWLERARDLTLDHLIPDEE